MRGSKSSHSGELRILITGVAGFIGSNLADKLLAKKQNSGRERQKFQDHLRVIGIDNLSCGVREQIPDAVEFHQLDIRSRAIYPLFEGVDYVFHLAAKNCIMDCQSDPVETVEINVSGTVNVFEAARRGKVGKVIFAESSALYEGSRILPTPESDVHPESFYSISKLASMYFSKAYESFFNLRFTALRYFNVYGPRQDYRRSFSPVMSAFIIKLLKREAPIIYGTGEKRRDFVHVDDVNDFHLRCLNDRRTDGKTFNLGSGKNYSMREIYRMISEGLGIDVTPISYPDLPGEAQETLADITHAKSLGWAPRVDIQQGLRGLIEYIQEEMKSGKIE